MIARLIGGLPMSPQSVNFIVNPMANKGSCGRRWPEIRRGLESVFGSVPDAAIFFTTIPGHATSLARQAARAGCKRLVSVGGDGTFSEMLNGVIEADRPISPDLVLGQFPGGTSNALALGCGHLEFASACRAAASPRTRRIDVFRADATAPDGQPVSRYGFLLSIVGAPATISWRAQRVPILKRLGPVAYVIMTAITTLTCSPREITVAFDDEPAGTRRLWGLMLCSFASAGEGLELAPGADPGDGNLDVVEVGDFSRLEALTRLVPNLADGSYVHHPKVSRRHVSSIRLDSGSLIRADVDGESIGRLPMTVRVLPFKLPVAVL